MLKKSISIIVSIGVFFILGWFLLKQTHQLQQFSSSIESIEGYHSDSMGISFEYPTQDWYVYEKRAEIYAKIQDATYTKDVEALSKETINSLRTISLKSKQNNHVAMTIELLPYLCKNSIDIAYQQAWSVRSQTDFNEQFKYKDVLVVDDTSQTLNTGLILCYEQRSYVIYLEAESFYQLPLWEQKVLNSVQFLAVADTLVEFLRDDDSNSMVIQQMRNQFFVQPSENNEMNVYRSDVQGIRFKYPKIWSVREDLDTSIENLGNPFERAKSFIPTTIFGSYVYKELPLSSSRYFLLKMFNASCRTSQDVVSRYIEFDLKNGYINDPSEIKRVSFNTPFWSGEIISQAEGLSWGKLVFCGNGRSYSILLFDNVGSDDNPQLPEEQAEILRSLEPLKTAIGFHDNLIKQENKLYLPLITQN